MRGVPAFARVGSSALIALSPFEAAALDIAGGAQARSLAAASTTLRGAAIGVLLLGALLVFAAWLRRERSLGRGAPATPETDVDAEWLERNVFNLSPELVGAAYDQQVAEPEVAAVLARMCGESKLASRVAAGARGWNNLELWLLVERDELGDYERELVERLFGSRKTTSADLIRDENRSAGFEPAAILRGPLSAACDVALGVKPVRRWLLWGGVGLGALGLGLTAPRDGAGILGMLLAAAVGSLGPLVSALVSGPRYRRDVARRPARALPGLASAGASVAALAALIGTLPGLTALASVSVAAWGLLGALLAAVATSSRESARGLALRRNLCAARRFLAGELERPEPRLRDEWLPYLIALELGAEVERWHQAFGRIETGAHRERLTRRAACTPPAAPATTSDWTGGAGALGGVGPSGPWIAATAGLTVAAGRDVSGPAVMPERKLALGLPA